MSEFFLFKGIKKQLLEIKFNERFALQGQNDTYRYYVIKQQMHFKRSFQYASNLITVERNSPCM